MAKISGWENVCETYVDNVGDLEKSIASDDAVVFFMASWCGPCNFLTAEADGDVNYFIGKGVRSIYVDVDEIKGNVGMESQYGVGAVPTVLAYRNGKLVNSLVGIGDYKELKSVVWGK